MLYALLNVWKANVIFLATRWQPYLVEKRNKRPSADTSLLAEAIMYEARAGITAHWKIIGNYLAQAVDDRRGLIMG